MKNSGMMSMTLREVLTQKPDAFRLVLLWVRRGMVLQVFVFFDLVACEGWLFLPAQCWALAAMSSLNQAAKLEDTNT